MRQPALIALLLGFALPASAQQAQQQQQQQQQQQSQRQGAAQMPQAQAMLIDRQGQALGNVGLLQTPAGLLLTVEARGLPPGLHGFHIHETGRCEAQGGFTSAGGHYAPRGRQHGFLVQGGPHAGDMPNQFVGPDGVLRTQVLNDRVTLGPGEATLADADGSALVIHAQPDDYRSQPAGDAGDRIACAVISRGR